MAGWPASLVSTLRSLVPKKEEILGRSSDGESWAVCDGIVKFSLGILLGPELPWSDIWRLTDTEIDLPGFLLLCSLCRDCRLVRRIFTKIPPRFSMYV
jgi:hypothetical protein